jgi:hypothetical protein
MIPPSAAQDHPTACEKACIVFEPASTSTSLTGNQTSHAQEAARVVAVVAQRVKQPTVHSRVARLEADIGDCVSSAS